MSLKEEFNRRNDEIQKKIVLEIEQVKKGYSKKDMLQLKAILKELQNIEEDGSVVLSYPRIIIDSWDYSDQIGIELMELAELYKKM